MAIFMSYSSHNGEVIKTLVRGLESARKHVWYDFEIDGGELWWTRILANIRECTVFVFGISDHSLQSKACMAEFGYATALRKPIVPVIVGKLEMKLVNPLASLHFVVYRRDDADSGFQVLAAVDAAERRTGPLPDPLPEAPAIPNGYLQALAVKIETDDLSFSEQEDVVEQLRKALRVESDPNIRRQVFGMLRSLNSKPWIAKQSELDINHVLAVEAQATSSQEAEENAQPENETSAGPTPPLDGPTSQELFEERMAGVRRQLKEEEERRQADEQRLHGTWESGDTTAESASDPSRHAAIWEGIDAPSEPFHPESNQPEPRWQEPPNIAWDGTAGHTWQGSGFQPPYIPPPPAYGSPQPPYAPQPTLPSQPYTMTVSYGAPAQRVSPPNYWALSIVAFFFVFLFGAIAMYFSYQVGQRFNAHDFDGAQRASRNAKSWGIAGIIVGVIAFLIAVGSQQ